ncbi:TylF/MycF/NovP-related O-methyltransferase [Sinorhizobium sp. 8-89]|uniref:TylF/MycF/NovP-related O-methyltransferase n=1 Tax=Sinorhizobium sp. 7-81 TaxID=3049087 RepID=UPI0024C30E67|nr:TylF/MycF/NovP-related O-methyltransferase [Sinorhizobium sp. 7-81]MDK1389459.1 TylF/MycF/NovP-related O-methyltransferase [Sinorhizobium sp. 7-81]
MTVVLPEFGEAPERSRGRNVRAGYQRGRGLRSGDLVSQLHQDKLYNKAMKLARKRTIVAEPKRLNLYLILRFGFEGLAPGHIVEFGSYRGGNALFMAAVCRELHPGMQVYAFDTFEGMPATDPQRDAHRAGDFKDAGYEELLQLIEKEKIDNLHLVRGLFEDTAEAALKAISSVRLNHIDCDIYSAVKYSYNVSEKYMVDGGYWVFDDPLCSGCIGAMEAVEETLIQRDGRFAEQVYPHLVYRNWPPN